MMCIFSSALSFKGIYLGNLYRLAGAEWPQGWSSFGQYQESWPLYHIADWTQFDPTMQCISTKFAKFEWKQQPFKTFITFDNLS